MTETPKPQLDYAPADPLRRRKRVRRIVLLVVLLALVYPAYRYGPGAVRQTRLLYLQHRCLNYTAPPNQVVYDQDSPTTAERWNMPGFIDLSPVKISSIEAVEPEAWGLFPDQLRDFSVYLPRGSFMGATLFLHERISKTGVRRIVVIQRPMVRNEYPIYWVFGVQVHLIDPATFSKPPATIYPRRMMQSIDWSSSAGAPPTKGLRFYAGQIDKSDEAHFTIQYELDGTRGLIDGRLNDAGDDVILRVLDGPAINTVWVTQVLP